MSKTEAQFMSEGIVDLVIFGLIILAGLYAIPDVESTWYPPVASMIIIQSLIGYLLSESGRILPPHSDLIEAGCIDIQWGFKRFWRNIFWPLNLI